MGGAGGHMWHPFDCPDVNSGQDLISFFQKSIEAIRSNPAALKIDGVNLSFRLRQSAGSPTGYEFVVDRGSMKPLDVEGVTADTADQRFITKDGSPHGMVEATQILLNIFNAAIPEIMPELEQLGMTQDIGPFSLYFNTEFVLKKINVKEYPFNFIAIHGVNKFVPKGRNSRKGVGVDTDQALLDNIRDKVSAFAEQQDFRVYTSIPANVNKSVLLDDALNEQFTIVYKGFSRDPEEPEELGAGEGSTKPIKAWLFDVSENPVNKKVNISDRMREIYPSMGRSQTPYAKNIYLEILKGTAVSDIALGPEDVEAIVDAAVVMHATRILGNAVLDALESEEFGSAREQEGVVVRDPNICGGTPFKFTGDFIVGGLASTFEEAAFRKGPLLESFFPEPMNLAEQEEKQYVILIPGGFKPPTGGHYDLIKQYDENSNVRKVFVVTGAKERDGITLQQSKDIFAIYGGFSDKVEFITATDPTPLTTCYELMKNENFVNQFPNALFSIGAGDKGNDPARIKQFADYFAKNPNLSAAEIAAHPPAKAYMVDGEAASASRLRKAYAEEDWETFKKLLPHESLYDNVVRIMSGQAGGPVNENFLLAVPQSFLVNEVYSEKQRRFMCAVKDKPASERPEGLSAAEAEEMCKSEGLKKVNEQEEASAEEKLEDTANKLGEFRANISKSISDIVDSLGLADMDEDTRKEFEDSIVATLQSRLGLAGQVTEMSSMAGGAVQGYAGNAFIGEEDDD